jgi:hypothetical protein
LAWETGNELGGWDEKPPPADWTIQMAKKVKSISPNALVMDGTMGGLNGGSRYQYDALNSPFVDMFSNHYYYGGSDYDRIKKDTKQIAEYSNKVFILGEFGFKYDVCKQIYQITLDEPKIAGALICIYYLIKGVCVLLAGMVGFTHTVKEMIIIVFMSQVSHRAMGSVKMIIEWPK